MPSVCQDPDCDRKQYYGLRMMPKFRFCAAHKLPGMTNKPTPRCKVHDCRKVTRGPLVTAQMPAFLTRSMLSRKMSSSMMYPVQALDNIDRLRITCFTGARVPAGSSLSDNPTVL